MMKILSLQEGFAISTCFSWKQVPGHTICLLTGAVPMVLDTNMERNPLLKLRIKTDEKNLVLVTRTWRGNR